MCVGGWCWNLLEKVSPVGTEVALVVEDKTGWRQSCGGVVESLNFRLGI